MARRCAVVAVALAVLIAGLLWSRSSDRRAPDRRASSTSGEPRRPQRSPDPALRPVHQPPAIALAPPPEAAPSNPAPAGAFEGRVVSAPTGKGLPGAQLTFARAEEVSSVAAGPEGAFRFDARV